MTEISGAGLGRILSELTRQEAYPHPVRRIEVLQTHTSCVFLTGKYAYKVKKPVNFGFLNYSTQELRHKFCEKELFLNRRLCPDLYLDVVPIADDSGQLKIGGNGNVIDSAVRMIQLPQSEMFSERLLNNTVPVSLIEKLAQVLVTFHKNAITNPEISEFGTPGQIRNNIAENFQQTLQFLNGTTLPVDQFSNIKEYSERLLADQESLFLNRKEAGCVRDGHGDLRIQNICLDPHLQNGIQIFDCIEFNDRFRCEDVAADLAYLAMDLDLSGRADLRMFLIQEYSSFSGDQNLNRILPFYQCYRAYVRAKIAMFASVEKEIPEDQRQKHKELAAAAFDLSNSYARPQTQPVLLITSGVSGSGKSVLSREVARRLPAILLSSDQIRKELAGASLNQGLDASWYQPEKVATVYEELRKRAKAFLQKGENVILDATFLSEKERTAAAALASFIGVKFRILACQCPPNVARDRVQSRNQDHADPSDATLSVLEEQLKHYQAVKENAIVLKTESPPPQLAREVLASI